MVGRFSLLLEKKNLYGVVFVRSCVPHFWLPWPGVGSFYLICTSSSAETAGGVDAAGLCGARHESKIDT